MTEPQRAEIRNIVDHFRGQKVAQEVLSQYCERMHFEPIVVGDLADYTYQVEHDERVNELFPKILAELQRIKYVPEFADEKVRKAIREENDLVRVSVTQLMEEHAIPYRIVNTLGSELGNIVGQTIEMAGTTAFNKALDVMLHIAREKFGGEFNMKHAADYAKEIYDAAAKEKKK